MTRLSFKSFTLQDVTQIGICGFFDIDSKPPEMNMGKNHDTLSEHKQSLYEVRSFNIFRKKSIERTKILHFFFQ